MSVDQISYKDLLQDPDQAEAYIQEIFAICEKNGFIHWLLSEIARESKGPEEAYPAQGLVFTGYEGFGDIEPKRDELQPQLVDTTILAWLYYLTLNNHPDRLQSLYEQSEKPFVPPQEIESPIFENARKERRAINIADLKLQVGGTDKSRRSRTELHQSGPFVSYYHPTDKEPSKGRKQARGVIVAGANPEITGSPFALATLVQSHSLASVPRDGLFSKIQRQVDLVRKTIEFLERSPMLYNKDEEERKKLLEFYTHNLVGVIEPEPKKALKRARALYEAGIRTFRIYSPEPGNDSLRTLVDLRKAENEEGWEPIEIFVGQVVDVEQAIALQKAGADALYFGIGGGGRCITGVVGGLTINWPQLVWDLRGKISVPMLVEGGANDYISESLTIGASGIGTVGKFGGTIETPGSIAFYIDEEGQVFKFYGGEASDRMRVMGGRKGPFGFVLNTEGETTKKKKRNGVQRLPTLSQVLHELNQGVVAGMVFQNAGSVSELQQLANRSLLQASPNDDASRHTHNK